MEGENHELETGENFRGAVRASDVGCVGVAGMRADVRE